jgi:hypothetical protein
MGDDAAVACGLAVDCKAAPSGELKCRAAKLPFAAWKGAEVSPALAGKGREAVAAEVKTVVDAEAADAMLTCAVALPSMPWLGELSCPISICRLRGSADAQRTHRASAQAQWASSEQASTCLRISAAAG